MYTGTDYPEYCRKFRHISRSTHCLVRDLQQIQHHSVSSHVLQQPLLLHATLLRRVTQLTETLQDLPTNTTELLKHEDALSDDEACSQNIHCSIYRFI